MTLKQIAEEIGLPESSVRLYRDEFEEFLVATGEGRRRRYGTDALETMQRIVALKKAGASGATIRQELLRTHTPQEVKRARTQEERLTDVIVLLSAQQSEIALLRAEVGALRGEIGRLVTLLEQERHAVPTMESVQHLRFR
jgi:DNA-binding transcriptional MerR regulator